MRRWVDLHVRPPLADEAIRNVASTASMLGYSMLGLVFTEAASKEKIGEVRKICADYGIDLVSRVDLMVGNRSELLSMLRKVRRRFEVVGVVCVSGAIAHVAARDQRVDVLNFPANRMLTKGVAELASGGMTALEINAIEIIGTRGFPRINLLSKFRQEARIARRYGVPIVASSGARDKFALRAPRDLAFLVASLLDVESQTALKLVSENPLGIVERNREKLSPRHVMPGVRIVAEKEKTVSAH